MSATNRGAERMPEDAYPTPFWAVERLLEACPLPREGTWLEPCAGEGAIVRVVKQKHGSHHHILTVDTRDTRDALEEAGVARSSMHVGSYLDWTLPRGPLSVIITNPPFSLALPIIQKALTESDWVAMLLRLNFLGSAERSGWLRNEMPDIYTLPDRPNFVASYKCKPRDAHDRGCGWKAMLPVAAEAIRVCPDCGRKVQRSTSDSAEYGWFVWTPDRGRTAGKTVILASTPEGERKAA